MTGAELRELRLRLGLSQEALARALGKRRLAIVEAERREEISKETELACRWLEHQASQPT